MLKFVSDRYQITIMNIKISSKSRSWATSPWKRGAFGIGYQVEVNRKTEMLAHILLLPLLT